VLPGSRGVKSIHIAPGLISAPLAHISTNARVNCVERNRVLRSYFEIRDMGG
jgi:hypothetical protein